jgi:serine/threonine protein kinase/tetratricopeptide (TPR) repeat protein
MQTGTEIAGRFRITAQIGAGGMGEVYRARDMRLRRDVAIKALPADLASNPGRVRRFEREARAAAALNHPNILALHDVGDHDGTPYLVTELLEGESLRECIARGPLPVKDAVWISVQVARGLAAAHSKGVLHRDLKPDNLFVTADGTIKILDFGLASLRNEEAGDGSLGEAPTESALTHAGAVLGTAGYMAPEQLRGQSVDQRADIFAVGCVLYEMLTGRRAFSGDTVADKVGAILRHQPSRIDTSESEITPALAQLVERCLEKRAANRFSSAHDLALALEASANDVAPHIAQAAEDSRPRLRRNTLLALFAATVLVAMVAAVWLLSSRSGGGPEVTLDSARVMVSPFENATGADSLDPISTRVADAIVRGLTDTHDIDVVQAPDGLSPGDEKALCAAARAEGAGILASGSFYRSDDTVELRGRLVDTTSGKAIYVLKPEPGPRGQPEEAIDRVRQRMMSGVKIHLGEHPGLGGIRRLPLYSAVREWEVGRNLYVAEGNRHAAREHYQKAIELDPGFWIPRIFFTMSYYGTGNDPKLEELLRDLHANQDRMDEAEQLYMRTAEALWEGRKLEQLRLARSLLALAPQDILYRLIAANAAIALNRPKEGLQNLGDLTTIDWDALGASAKTANLINLSATAHHLLGEHEAELEVVQYGLGLYPDSLGLRRAQAAALAALGRAADVEIVVIEALHSSRQGVTPQDVVVTACEELRAHGHLEDARRIAGLAADRYSERPPQEAESVVSVLDQVEFLALAERWDEAHRLARQTYEAYPNEPRARAYWGIAAARAGDREVALGMGSTLAGQSHVPYMFRRVPLWPRADIAAQLGDKDGAVEALRAALGSGAPHYDLHVDPNLEPLHGYPAFEELMKPKG